VEGGQGGGRMGIVFIDVFGELRRYINPTGIARIFKEPWVVNITFNIIASAIFIFFSSWKLKPVKKGI